MRSWWSRRSGGLASMVVVAVVAAASLTGCAPPKNYVSLGDSFTSGPLIPVQRDDPTGCLRSTNNYPSLVAPSLAAREHRDPSCSGGQTKHMTEPQGVDPGGPNPPQFDSLDADTRVVTLGIGGNDIGFSEIATTCGGLTRTDPLGAPCKAHYNEGGTDQIAARITATASKVDAVLDGIRSRALRAQIFVVGYPAILPEVVTTAVWLACVETLPVALEDMNWLRDDVEKALNTMLRTQAEANGAVYVDTYTGSIGHDACKPPIVRWVEPVAPGDVAAPVHPNIRGMEGSKVAVLEAMDANGVPMR
ncbi:MAG: SGNH/GDSL hydrolase family protein [Acidimicrobiales bacterium]